MGQHGRGWSRLIGLEPVARGDVWLVALGAARPGEPGKTRPAVVVTADALAPEGARDLVVLVPLSSSLDPTPLRVPVSAVVGIDRQSLAVCRAVRAVARSRLLRRIGQVGGATLGDIDAALSLVLSDPRARRS